MFLGEQELRSPLSNSSSSMKDLKEREIHNWRCKTARGTKRRTRAEESQWAIQLWSKNSRVLVCGVRFSRDLENSKWLASPAELSLNTTENLIFFFLQVNPAYSSILIYSNMKGQVCAKEASELIKPRVEILIQPYTCTNGWRFKGKIMLGRCSATTAHKTSFSLRWHRFYKCLEVWITCLIRPRSGEG